MHNVEANNLSNSRVCNREENIVLIFDHYPAQSWGWFAFQAGKWEVRSEKWEVRSEKWEVRSEKCFFFCQKCHKFCFAPVLVQEAAIRNNKYTVNFIDCHKLIALTSSTHRPTTLSARIKVLSEYVNKQMISITRFL